MALSDNHGPYLVTKKFTASAERRDSVKIDRAEK
jgi:hypothetical protein